MALDRERRISQPFKNRLVHLRGSGIYGKAVQSLSLLPKRVQVVFEQETFVSLVIIIAGRTRGAFNRPPFDPPLPAPLSIPFLFSPTHLDNHKRIATKTF